MVCVIRDERGVEMHVGAKRGNNASPLQIKALAMQFACLEAFKPWPQSFIDLEGDSMSVINAVFGIGAGHWEIVLIASDIRALLSSFQDVPISHMFRKANFAADKVAGLGHRHQQSELLSHLEFMSIARKDAFGEKFSCA